MTITGFVRIVAASILATTFSWPLLPRVHGAVIGVYAHQPSTEWPRVLDGEQLRPLAMNDVERRFAASFPGVIGRFASDEATWILRRVERPTRMLHPAADCYRASGYSIRDERLSLGPRGLQRCFVAARDSGNLNVCERIVDADGKAFTDTSAWYWAAALGRSRGPWLATTRAGLAG
jgi:hypothetical protein